MEVAIEELKRILGDTSFGKNANFLIGSDLLREEGVDSLDLLDFYLKVEEHYKIKIPDEDVAELKTLADYQRYISSKLFNI